MGRIEEPAAKWTHITVPLAGGIGTDTDRRMRAPERLEVAYNVRCPRVGTLGTRFGFKPLTDNVAGTGGTVQLSTNGPVRSIGSTRKELFAVGHRNLYAWHPNLAAWVDRGHVAPCLGDRQEVFRANVHYPMADGARYANAVIYAAIRYETWGTPGIDAYLPRYAIEFRGKDVSGDEIFLPEVVERTPTDDTFPYAVRCAAHGWGVVILWAENTAGGAPFTATLNAYNYSNTTPWAAPAAIPSITTDLWYWAGHRTFDCIECDNGDYFIAYIEGNRNIELRRYDQTHAWLATSNIGWVDFYAVALCESDDNDIYVLTARLDQETDVIELWHYSGAGVYIWGPVLLETLDMGGTADNLGVVEGNNGTELRVSCVWQVGAEMHSRSTNVLGGALDVGTTNFNVSPMSRPWFHRNRCYVHAATIGGVESLGFQSNLLFDLLPGDADREDEAILMAALWGVGMATAGTLGCNNNVWVMPDAATYRLMCAYLGEVVKSVHVCALDFWSKRDSYDDVGFEFDAIAETVSLHHGAAVIGGAYNVWYDGAQCFELSFARPPTAADAVQTPGNVEPGDYHYYACWVHTDSGGIKHRSVPSPALWVEVEAESKDVALYAYTLPGSRRPPRDMTCEWYRSGLDAIPRRVNRSQTLIPNNLMAPTTTPLTDIYAPAALYIPLYTTGGVLEAAAPEGSRFPIVARDRLLLADFYHHNEIQLSKFVVPGATGETSIAPEFHEAMARIAATGERLTGVAYLDTTTIIFSAKHIWLVTGYGPDARGAGDDTSRLTELPTDCGCIEPRSVCMGPDGVFFQTIHGICLLRRDHSVQPIGEPVRALMDTYPVVTSAVLVASERQVRFTATNAAQTAGRILVYDYRIGQWFEWEIQVNPEGTHVVPVSAAHIDDIYYILRSDGVVWWEDVSTHYDNTTYYVPMIVETGDIQPAGPNQWMHVREASVLCEWKDDHRFTASVYYNHNSTIDDTATWSAAEVLLLADAADREQFSYTPPTQKLQAIRFRFESAADGTPVNGQGFEIHSLGLEVALTGRLPQDGQQARK